MKRWHGVRAGAAALALSLALPAAAFAGAEDAIGTWRDTETGGVTSIYSCDGGICIKVLTPGKGHERDDYNSNPALKGRSMAGVVIMEGAAKSGADRWKGKLYNGEDGDTYTGYVISTAKDEVKLEGCVLGGLICKSRRWTREK
ncbi:MAG: DUF2147 domain-containing protein [Rhodomicrobium sp.]|jgi:uncharacterized protein (DUF2147 family)